MDRTQYLEAMLGVMERKRHWAWPLFTAGKVASDRLHLHFEQEYATYVRDFPVMVGWAYVQCPHPVVRRMLAENLYEEETGGLVAHRPHPELFLEYPKGLGMDLRRFDHVELLPAARQYRERLDMFLQGHGWEVACAVATVFVEGTEYERGEVDSSAVKRPVIPLEQHPLVVHYHLPLESLALTKAHRQVEGQHRASAWEALLDYSAPQRRTAVVEAMETVLAAWQSYRDEVSTACGLVRDETAR